MFDDWKNAWRQAVENFQREVRGADEHAPPRVRAMERELVSAAGALGRLDDEIRRTRRSLDAEREALDACHRRGELARNAGDDETARIAAEFAVRHEERAAVLTRKLAVLEDERSLLDRDIDEMRRLVVDAGQAFGPGESGLGSGGGSGGGSTGTGSGGTGGGAGSHTFDEAAAARDRDFSRLEREARERAAAERLEELKRRMQN